ncbi:MAG: hypothetical protein ACTS2F_17230 [Thainema sp.]
MLWIALFLFGCAIALWLHGQRQIDEVIQFLEISLALVSLMAGLVAAPWLLKTGVLIALMVCPTCTPCDRILKSNCPKYCLFRTQCRSDYKPHSRRLL